MQTKKDDIKQDILTAASHEFAHKGYQKSSLRTIAIKANTTLGNLYNYFPNKEAILDEIIDDIPNKIQHIINRHNDPDMMAKFGDNIRSDEATKLMTELFPFEVLLSEPFIILMEGCEGTKYESYKVLFTTAFSDHVANHLNIKNGNAFLPQSFTHGGITAILIIAKSKKSMNDKIKDLSDYIYTMTYGLPIIRDKNNK